MVSGRGIQKVTAPQRNSHCSPSGRECPQETCIEDVGMQGGQEGRCSVEGRMVSDPWWHHWEAVSQSCVNQGLTAVLAAQPRWRAQREMHVLVGEQKRLQGPPKPSMGTGRLVGPQCHLLLGLKLSMTITMSITIIIIILLMFHR